jgi:hypothetical protein
MENLKKIVSNSETYKEVIEKLGWNVNGSNYNKIKKLIIENEISTIHFLTSSEFLKKYNPVIYDKIDINEIMVENSFYSRSNLKRRIIKEKIIPYSCELCENNGIWMNKKISLILDHKNGVNNDHRKNNLRFVCPNCNATLDTHCGKNIKNKKEKIKREVDYNIKKNFHLRKVIRPSYETLINDVKENGYVATGKKFGVSDNSIRKWIKNYENKRFY